MVVKVLGPGCKNCKNLYNNTMEAIKNIEKDIEVEYITDMSEIMELGVISSPALIVNDKIVSQGNKNLKVSDIENLISNNI